MGRYNRYLPDQNSPLRFRGTLQKFEKLYCSGRTKHERSKVHKLRVNPKRRTEIKRLRHRLGIPEAGYGRREAKRQLGRFAQAYVELEHNKKGAYKRKTEAGAWLFIIRCAQQLADAYRFTKHYPAPLTLCFEDLVYKRPQPNPILRGYFTEGDEPTVLLEDAVTKAPETIALVVKYKLRGDDNEIVRRIRIFNRHANSGEWQITNLDSNPAK
ncbi:hypothetical protein ES703_11257 [subsurface metagenome]